MFVYTFQEYRIISEFKNVIVIVYATANVNI